MVLQDMNLQIAAGESVVILGPNGCGKSTLIKTLTCELYPVLQPGMRLRLFGRERWDVAELRRRMGLVTADAPMRDSLQTSGLEVVLSGFFSAARLWPHLHVTPRMREQAWQAMHDLLIEHLADRPLQAMSAGQQKRTLIARALVASGDGGGKRVLLLDEPSNALDLAAQKELRATLRLLAQQGTGIILVTHRVEDIVPEVRRVLLMQEGSIAADGPTANLLTSERLSQIFASPIHVEQRDDGSYTAR